MQKQFNTKQHQQGLSLWGLLFGAVFVSVIALLAMKVLPIYLEQHQVDAALASLESEPGWGSKSSSEIRAKINKFLDINQVDTVKPEHIVIKREDGQTQVRIKYERRTALVHTFDIVGNYDKTVVLTSNN